ncbi:FAD-linked sulfhydryl oxidase ERV1 isoform X2 [Actinidia eriantha]|uniref:FAD-linked sulfhydryl oxidase ERV1 isoform X2 n=1 Tax=Actinidia eriantha TaxID=165200 RepID=UPI002583EEE4|nr:FAD-linked sulfhydryl oxidase ERV1 isoform X2 [Actinidia eriantha]
MSENTLQAIFQTFEKISQCIQTHLPQFAGLSNNPSPTNGSPISSSFKANPLNAIENSILQTKEIANEGKSAAPVTKEALGRATWTFLHTLAAQYPDRPTRQQRKDVKELMEILSRMYPCKECADHFKEVLRSNPVQAGSQAEFSQWLCHVHNVVNRRLVPLGPNKHQHQLVTNLGKLVFSCERVDARWGKLDCEKRACDLQGITSFDDKMH